MRCGRASCACHSDPPHLHGPYWQWTRKVAGKTVTRYISPQTASDYQSWLENDRRIRELVGRLEALGVAHLGACLSNRNRSEIRRFRGYKNVGLPASMWSR
jgi:hypothetical protein